MILSPVLARLRRDPASRLAAQAAMEAARDGWRESPEFAPVLSELARFGESAALADCPSLARLFGDHSWALHFVERFVAVHTSALSAHPLGHVALRFQAKPGLATIQLAYSGRANLSLVAFAPRAIPPAESVCFAGGERHEMALAGGAAIRLFTLDGDSGGRARISCAERNWRAGEYICIEDPRRTRTIDRADKGLVVLRLAREAVEPVPSREFLCDGALLHVASGDRAESRAEMAAEVLGAMGRRDAAPALADMARAGSDHLRWQALRQLLALDSGAGFAVLAQIAGDGGDPLSVAAEALRDSLLERHPQLCQVAMPCPA